MRRVAKIIILCSQQQQQQQREKNENKMKIHFNILKHKMENCVHCALLYYIIVTGI